jgi:hypothetical protein
VIIKGGARTGAAGYLSYLSKHLQRTDTNEKITVRELRGIAADDLLGAFQEMAAYAAGTRCTRALYHANIDPHPTQPALTEAQKLRAVELLEKELGLEGQARAVVEHVKDGRPHLHVVWSRIDLETMTAISDSHNYRRHEIVARELEREFGHQRVQGAHAEREGQARPERTPSDNEQRQAERSGITPKEATAFVTELWQATDSGQSFKAAIEAEGWIVAKGDRRDFVLLDLAGETHNLAKRVEGAKAKDVRQRMADLDATILPDVETARTRQQEAARLEPDKPREAARVIEAEAASPQAEPVKDAHHQEKEGGGVSAALLPYHTQDFSRGVDELMEELDQYGKIRPPRPPPDIAPTTAKLEEELKTYAEKRQAGAYKEPGRSSDPARAYLEEVKQRAEVRERLEQARQRPDQLDRGRDRDR